MVSVTVTVSYLENGNQVSTDVTASAKTYSEAFHKASTMVDELTNLNHVVAMFVKSIVYT